jgi:hypothetical protein
VGLTRGKNQVFLTQTRSRTLWGQRRRGRLSPLAEAVNPLRQSQEKGPRSKKQRSLFPELRPQGTPRGRRRSQGPLFPQAPEEPKR